jgi:RNA polymerase sigma-70 factor (ECF subfamily)
MPAIASVRGGNITAQPLTPRITSKGRRLDGSIYSASESAPRNSAPPFPAADIDTNDLTEAEIIKRAQQGDAAMFEELYRKHSGRVYAVCMRMVKDPSEAEDLTQETFLLLFRKIHTFRGESAFSTWLHRLAVNGVLMRLRRKSLPAVSIDGPLDPDELSGPPVIEIGCTDVLLAGSLDRINLHRCIKRLPPGSRTVFVLHDVRGYKHQEIADILGRSVGDSKSQLHRARAQLRSLLHEFERAKRRDCRLAAKR